LPAFSKRYQLDKDTFILNEIYNIHFMVHHDLKLVYLMVYIKLIFTYFFKKIKIKNINLYISLNTLILNKESHILHLFTLMVVFREPSLFIRNPDPLRLRYSSTSCERRISEISPLQLSSPFLFIFFFYGFHKQKRFGLLNF